MTLIMSGISQKNELFNANQKATEEDSVHIDDLSGPNLDDLVGDKDAAQLREDASLIEGVYGDFDNDAYLKGQTAPVFFGSAINNFGVKELLDTFIRISPELS